MDAETGKLIAVSLLNFFFIPFGIILLLTIAREIFIQ